MTGALVVRLAQTFAVFESGRSVGCVMGRFRKVIRLGSEAFEERDDGLKAETGESGQGGIEERSCRSGVRTGRVCGKVPGTRASGVEGVERASPGLRPVRVACCSLLVGRVA